VDYPGDDTDNRLAPGRFNPATGDFSSGDRGTIPPVKGKLLAPAINGTLPLLGGPAYRSYERAGATWHCGSRGLVIFPGREAPVLDFAPMKVRHLPNFDLLQRAEAEQLRVPYPIPLAVLKELASHQNRHVRVKALAPNLQNNGDEGDIPILIDSLDDPYFKIRAVATIRLANHAGAAALPGLRKSLADRDFRIRSIAALALAKLGEIPDLAFFDEILAKCGNDNSFALGWDIPIGYSLEKEKVYTVLAPRADRKVFELLLRHQLLGDYYLQKLYPVFGESLRRHPEAAEVLLALQDSTRHGPLRDFAQGVFQHAGKDLLPVLHAALASDDRVVRSNAARACGAIGELSSIPVLIQSLDMESGLARASIVWALGELKARDAVPKLIALHQDARNASHNRQAGSGYLAQQSITASREQYTALRNLDAIASDWDEMKITALRRPRDPRRDEELLTPELVLEAIRKIGPAAAQVFYRSLAAASDSNDRAEAALGLAEPTDRESNLKILRNLADDPVQEVSLRARVSLVVLGEPGADGFLLDRLHAGGEQERRTILVQLDRLSASQLGAFRQALEAIAKNPREPYLRDLAAALAGKK
jgi:HEAT repeat protein